MQWRWAFRQRGQQRSIGGPIQPGRSPSLPLQSPRASIRQHRHRRHCRHHGYGQGPTERRSQVDGSFERRQRLRRPSPNSHQQGKFNWIHLAICLINIEGVESAFDVMGLTHLDNMIYLIDLNRNWGFSKYYGRNGWISFIYLFV